MKKIFSILLFSFSLILFSCSNLNQNNLKGVVSVKLPGVTQRTAYSKDDISSYSISCSKKTDEKEDENNITKTAGLDEIVTFDELDLGTYIISVKGLDKTEKEISRGKQEVELLPGDNKVTISMIMRKFFTISFEANGGEGSMESIIADEGETVKIPKNSFTDKHRDFENWTTSKNKMEAEVIENEGEITVTKDITLYANWGNEYIHWILKIPENEVISSEVQAELENAYKGTGNFPNSFYYSFKDNDDEIYKLPEINSLEGYYSNNGYKILELDDAFDVVSEAKKKLEMLNKNQQYFIETIKKLHWENDINNLSKYEINNNKDAINFLSGYVEYEPCINEILRFTGLTINDEELQVIQNLYNPYSGETKITETSDKKDFIIFSINTMLLN